MTKQDFTLSASLAVGVCLAASSLTAQTQAEMQRCAKLKVDAARLACFDAVVAAPSAQEEKTLEHAAAETETALSNWIVDNEADAFTDAKNVTAILMASSTSGRRGTVALVARCVAGEIEAAINWNNYLSDNSVVTVRFDKEQPVTSRWSPSTGQKATFATAPKAFMQSLVQHESLAARITPYREAPTTAIFDLSGSQAALGQVAEACGWSF